MEFAISDLPHIRIQVDGFRAREVLRTWRQLYVLQRSLDLIE